ncbi:MAG: D-alanine--D-alanine ligase family protein [Dethiobacteria bacterium]
MGKKLKVAVLFGGRSGEHAVSLVSAASIMAAMSKERYEIIPVGITEDGRWLCGGDPLQALQEKQIPGGCHFTSIATDPLAPGLFLWDAEARWQGFLPLDAVFPVLHGPYGEDGTVQGLLELAGLPYVGAGVLASAAGMDKAVMKILFQSRGLPVPAYLYFDSYAWQSDKKALMARIEKELGYPCFVKPANLGSSVGISKAVCRETLAQGIAGALLYDHKIIIETYIPGREIECSVLGNEEPMASVPGEIIPGAEFYDYRAKYIDNRARLLIPAPLKPAVVEKLQDYAVEAFQAVECSGLARIDFFYQEEEDKIYVNEINTLPGFTNISMYPKLWEASGIPYAKLIDRLIDFALEKHRRRKKLFTRWDFPSGTIT